MNAFDLNHVLSGSTPGLLAADMERPLYLPNKPLTEGTLSDWIATSVAGERIQYHQGLLLVDRSDANSTFPTKDRQRIHALAKRAWHACELGLVHLVSQRIEPFVFRYIAVRSLTTSKSALVRAQLRTTAH